jgi:hypothetical protein
MICGERIRVQTSGPVRGAGTVQLLSLSSIGLSKGRRELPALAIFISGYDKDSLDTRRENVV